MDTSIADTKDFTLGGTDLESDLHRLALQCTAKLVKGSLGSCKEGEIIVGNQIHYLSTISPKQAVVGRFGDTSHDKIQGEDEEEWQGHASPAYVSINLEVVRNASVHLNAATGFTVDVL